MGVSKIEIVILVNNERKMKKDKTMPVKNINKIITKYLNNEASVEEQEILLNWLDNSENKKEFKDFIALNYLVNKNAPDVNHLDALNDVLNEINKGKFISSSPIRLKTFLRYAAILIVVVGVSFFYKYNFSRQSKLVIQDEVITLQLENGQTKSIKLNERQDIVNLTGEVIATQGENIISYNSGVETEKLVYNELSIPYGKQFQVELSDGTKVYLNAGSKLKYPVIFLKDKERQVFLEGEAYFDVVSDTSRPFIVKASDMNIEVLGTHFNVNSYDKNKIFTVLVKGSISVFKEELRENQNFSKIIVPGQMAVLEKNEIEVSEVNIENFIGWKEGKLIFIDEQFQQVIQKIERKYNVEIQNNYKALNTSKFTGKFEEESIIDLMEVFKKSAQFDYKIEENKVIIKER